MNIDRIEALLWARIDGTIEPEELAELETHLAESPEPQKLERQVSAIASGLDELETAPTPSELRGRINDALEHAAPPEVRPHANVRTHSAPIWQAKWLPLAASLVIGVAIGYLMHPGTSGSIDQGGVSGSMLTPTIHPETAPVEITLDQGGNVVASRSETDLVVDVSVSAEIEVGVTLAGTAGPLSLAGLHASNASATEVTTEQGWVVLRTHGPGTLTLAVSASAPDEQLRLQVSVNGRPVEERWIGTGPDEDGP